ncbi:hypothetical protein [Aquiflexum gelatinilyticum]|uniref:hypothetical protein n=1 Tax=Aquiflexum gelatinilyticum TaxID=2961943 RepID=UPI002168B957|nr:hypothetical protein [Aquiflexum gelatinilyticum]MCS4435324.1 hypothetical protein [Aquiflexum gelatinilyticum]
MRLGEFMMVISEYRVLFYEITLQPDNNNKVKQTTITTTRTITTFRIRLNEFPHLCRLQFRMTDFQTRQH